MSNCFNERLWAFTDFRYSECHKEDIICAEWLYPASDFVEDNNHEWHYAEYRYAEYYNASECCAECQNAAFDGFQ
jgi:hypothetical protein